MKKIIPILLFLLLAVRSESSWLWTTNLHLFTGTEYSGQITLVPTNSTLEIDGGLSVGPAFNINVTGGYFSNWVDAGTYQVLIPNRRSFGIILPDDTNSYNLLALGSFPALIYAPAQPLISQHVLSGTNVVIVTNNAGTPNETVQINAALTSGGITQLAITNATVPSVIATTGYIPNSDPFGSAAAAQAAAEAFTVAGYQPLSTALNHWSTIDTNTYWGWVTTYVGAQGFLTANQTITISGDGTGSGTTAITFTLKNTGTAGTYTKPTFDAQGRETSGTTLALSDLPAGYNNGGNAATATVATSAINANLAINVPSGIIITNGVLTNGTVYGNLVGNGTYSTNAGSALTAASATNAPDGRNLAAMVDTNIYYLLSLGYTVVCPITNLPDANANPFYFSPLKGLLYISNAIASLPNYGANRTMVGGGKIVFVLTNYSPATVLVTNVGGGIMNYIFEASMFCGGGIICSTNPALRVVGYNRGVNFEMYNMYIASLTNQTTNLVEIGRSSTGTGANVATAIIANNWFGYWPYLTNNMDSYGYAGMTPPTTGNQIGQHNLNFLVDDGQADQITFTDNKFLGMQSFFLSPDHCDFTGNFFSYCGGSRAKNGSSATAWTSGIYSLGACLILGNTAMNQNQWYINNNSFYGCYAGYTSQSTVNHIVHNSYFEGTTLSEIGTQPILDGSFWNNSSTPAYGAPPADSLNGAADSLTNAFPNLGNEDVGYVSIPTGYAFEMGDQTSENLITSAWKEDGNFSDLFGGLYTNAPYNFQIATNANGGEELDLLVFGAGDQNWGSENQGYTPMSQIIFNPDGTVVITNQLGNTIFVVASNKIASSLPFTGNFNGTFTGSGSGLTNITLPWRDLIISNNFTITASATTNFIYSVISNCIVTLPAAFTVPITIRNDSITNFIITNAVANGSFWVALTTNSMGYQTSITNSFAKRAMTFFQDNATNVSMVWGERTKPELQQISDGEIATQPIPSANLNGALPAISGAALTGLNASQLISGTVPYGVLPPATNKVVGAWIYGNGYYDSTKGGMTFIPSGYGDAQYGRIYFNVQQFKNAMGSNWMISAALFATNSGTVLLNLGGTYATNPASPGFTSWTVNNYPVTFIASNITWFYRTNTMASPPFNETFYIYNNGPTNIWFPIGVLTLTNFP